MLVDLRRLQTLHDRDKLRGQPQLPSPVSPHVPQTAVLSLLSPKCVMNCCPAELLAHMPQDVVREVRAFAEMRDDDDLSSGSGAEAQERAEFDEGNGNYAPSSTSGSSQQGCAAAMFNGLALPWRHGSELLQQLGVGVG